MFYIISHIVSLVCNDKVFQFLNIISRMILTLEVRSNLNCQPILWRDEMLDVSIFRLLSSSNQGTSRKANEPLFYNLYHEWVKRLGEKIGFVQVLTTYYLRRATNNAINNKSRQLEPKKRFANYDKRSQLERGDAQSSSRSCHFDNILTKLSFSHDSLRHVSDLSRYRVARESNRCFSLNESHDQFTSISRIFSWTIAKSTTRCKHSRVARAIANSLRSNSQKVQLHILGKRSIDLRRISTRQTRHRSPT